MVREVGSLGAGEHVVTPSGQKIVPGVYVVRLTRAGRSLSRTAIVIP
jgi:hypothetical protein